MFLCMLMLAVANWSLLSNLFVSFEKLFAPAGFLGCATLIAMISSQKERKDGHFYLIF